MVRSIHVGVPIFRVNMIVNLKYLDSIAPYGIS